MSTLALVVPVYDEAERFEEFAKLLVAFIADQPHGSELLFVTGYLTNLSVLPALVRSTQLARAFGYSRPTNWKHAGDTR